MSSRDRERDFSTDYQALPSYYDDEHDEGPPGENLVHIVPDNNKSRWNHIENLDEFFARVYQYHQGNGFLCMVLQDILQLTQYMFVVLFSTFLIKCVDYQTLFYEKEYNHTHKVTIGESIYPMKQCLARFDGLLIICLIVAAVFGLFRLARVIYNIFQFSEIRAFYLYALRITATDLNNMTWHEVQKKLLEVQTEQQMCIHKQELTELDIYHRILRFKNYMIAMVNKSLLPLQIRVPFVGEYTFLTTGLRYNLDLLLFWGPWSPFENYWHLRADYKNYHKRKELADELGKKILYVGIANFLLSPLVFLWQILYFFFRYAEGVKREPGSLGSRKWSHYSRLYLRHFNELDHEFNSRLSRAYKPSEKYMNIFTSPLLALLAKYIAFFAGSILAVLVILTVIDEDVLAVSHVLATMTVLGAIVAICHSLIPDEHLVWCPEMLMRTILAQIHYMPDDWKGQAHTAKVRDEFNQLFQYRLVHLLEELFSPLVTPFILTFSLRKKSLEIVDFFRNFSFEITGVGDVCSFAQMDIRKHGNPQWVAESQTEANQYHQAEDGKTELSLVHFTLTNPNWKPPEASIHFINTLKEHVQKDATSLSMMPGMDNPLANSLHSLSSQGFGYNSMVSSIVQQSNFLSQQPSNIGTPVVTPSAGGGLGSTLTQRQGTGASLVGGIKNTEGPLGGSGAGLLSSVTGGPTSVQDNRNLRVSFSDPRTGGRPAPVQLGEDVLEFMNTEMSFSALYMHDLHRRRRDNPYMDNYEDLRARELWSHAGATDIATNDESLNPDPFNRDQQTLNREPQSLNISNVQSPSSLGPSLPPLGPVPMAPFMSNMPNIQEVREESPSPSAENRPLVEYDVPTTKPS